MIEKAPVPGPSPNQTLRSGVPLPFFRVASKKKACVLRGYLSPTDDSTNMQPHNKSCPIAVLQLNNHMFFHHQI
jgi:hypothetical protein